MERKEISPDYAAPGVNIIRLVPGNTYAVKTVINVAAPHTAGVAPLLMIATQSNREQKTGGTGLLEKLKTVCQLTII